MSDLTLYLAPGTCAMAVHIALTEAQAHHQVKRLDLVAGEQRSAAYLAINPKGRVPALVTERGVLTETPALLLYVAQRFPDALLAPLDDPFLLARMQEGGAVMKRGVLLNAPLSALVAQMGHTDEITVCDAGLPIPAGPERIDLALMAGTPNLQTVLKALLTDLVVEKVIMASEIKLISPDTHQALLDQIETHSLEQGKPIAIEYCLHEEFKTRSRQSKAIVRSGEITPYANLILCAGVAF
ncbi:D-ribose pyranase [Aeromonas salmonicida]|nr:D-ribose pyranase [Aeromonas salmonicida]GAJ49830.1 D-ribose pyranase [Aeromonas salmonicida subsp. masoucida NBRC 13784]